MNCNIKTQTQVELLAPARDKKTAITAINAGADAVYIGASGFGARKNAANSLDDIKEIVDYAHKFNVRVHVTINTILKDEELEPTKDLIHKLYDIGVDAIIVQDMAILKMAVEGKLPPIEIHASTQCDNRILEKVKFFEKIGVSRVILARELSIEQIEEICQNTSVEIETFIHGALCVSYSGQCYLSASIGGRSANRGECAQPCRKKYTLIDENGKVLADKKHLLSLRDFNASKHIERLIKAGVKSFKIEGRLKDENYVKNVTAFYRKEIDKFSDKTSSGKIFMDFEPDLQKSFNRGFTDYFLTGRTKCFNFETPKSIGEKIGKVLKVNKDYFILNGEIYPQDGLCWGEDGCLVNKVEGNKIFPNKSVNLKAGDIIYRNFDSKFEKQLENSKIKRQIGLNFEINNGILAAVDEDNNKSLIKIPAGETPKNLEKMKETFINQLKKTGESDFYAEDVHVNAELPFLPVSVINELRRKLLDNLLDERLKNYQRSFQKPLEYIDYFLPEMDYRANVYNSEAEKFYENCGCKIKEKAFESQTFSPDANECGLRNGVSRPDEGECKELMRTKHCLKYAFDMCKSPKKLFLVDEKGKRYKLKFDCKNCEMVVVY